jgi:hypothetical protein
LLQRLFCLSVGLRNPPLHLSLLFRKSCLQLKDFRLSLQQFLLPFGFLSSTVGRFVIRNFLCPYENFRLGWRIPVGKMLDAVFIDPNVYICMSHLTP